MLTFLHTHKKIVSKVLVTGVIIILILMALIFWLYFGPNSTLKTTMLDKLPIPIARVGSNWISSTEVSERMKLAEKLEKNGVEIENNTSLRAQITAKLISDKVTLAILKKRGVKLSQMDLDGTFASLNLVTKAGTPSSLSVLKKDYGISETELKKEILPSLVAKNKLQAWYNTQSNLDPETHKQIGLIKNRIVANDEFSKLVTLYSQDEATKPFYGDLGLLPKTELLPELASSTQSMDIGQTAVIQTPLGHHIVKVLDKIDENSIPKIHLQQIFLNSRGFEQWYKTEAKTINATIYINY
jgi:hypothetical protein